MEDVKIVVKEFKRVNLIVDVGNTLIKIAVFERNKQVERRTYEQLDGVALDELLKAWPEVERAIVGSTGGEATYYCDLLRSRSIACMEFTATTPVPIKNTYRSPATLGVDRLAAAVGAVEVAPGKNVMIVDCGTALTVDFVTADGTYRGGVISPGMQMRFRALHDFTARLPLCAATDVVEPYGDTTTSCIEQGVMNGMAYEIEGYMKRFEQENQKTCIFFTGGAANFFEKRIKNAIFADCELVFIGLNRILDFNAEC